MSINFDHTKTGTVTLQTEQCEYLSCFIFPSTENNNPLEVMVNCHSNCSYISGLNISGATDAFNYTNDVNSNCSFTYSVDSGSVTETFNAIILGHNGKSKFNYADGENYGFAQIDGAVVHSSNCIFNKGDSQSTTILFRAFTDSNSPSCLVYGYADLNSTLFSNIDVIGKTCDNLCYVAFNVKGALFKNSNDIFCTGNFVLTDIVSCNLNVNFNKYISLADGGANFKLIVENAANLNWLSRGCFLEIAATTGEAGQSTYGIYWTCSSNNYWFNLYNWYADQYINNAVEYPRSTTDVIMCGSCAAYVNIDCELWIEPNSIDTTRITDSKGICLDSNVGRAFSKNIYGNITLYGNAIFGDDFESKYWRNDIDTNWFNLNNWYPTDSFEQNSKKLPFSISTVFTCGNNAPLINLDCYLWVQPYSINAINTEGICIFSENACSFSGIIYGGVTLYGNAQFN